MGCLFYGGFPNLALSNGCSPIRAFNRNPTKVSSFMYQKFLAFAIEQIQLQTDLTPLRDLNPLHDVIENKDYKEKYYRSLLSLGKKYSEDPGQQLLLKLLGKSNAKELVRSFLFNGVDTLGTKTFLDFFPEYKCEDGTVNRKRGVIGKSSKTRPWDHNGEFVGEFLPQ